MFIDPNIPGANSSEPKGKAMDLLLLVEDAWMMDTEVKYLIQEIKGRWYVTMVFISIHVDIKMVARKIDHYHSKQKALIFAKIFQRGIRKDARGTLKREKHAYDICLN
ncbi:MAG: hypothetical protein MRZ79_15405 [Bacteroidia bacterium]|nr:hypothetical protein [Bacteroidia bacterium]